MAVEASLPAIGTVLGAAVIDSINPCAIGVFILLMSVTVTKKSRMFRIGLLYITAIFVTYLLAGLGLIAFLQRIPISIAEYISIAVGTLIVLAGIVEIKDFFWYGRGISLAIPEKRVKQIHEYTKNMSTPGIIMLGAFVAAVELPCTGGPYLAVTLLLSQNFNFTAFLLLVLYNLIFVFPLLVILTMVYFGTSLHAIKEWKHKNRAYMRLAMGLLLVSLGWLLMLIANGTINFA
ncbi:MAG: GAP family protein [Candidatus Aenigmarchaeota archaeon]|nr:GAP family protein [Candidatus Aenigmarchaeota archaeon]